MRLIIGTGKTSAIIQNENDIVLSRRDCDITNWVKLSRIIKEIKPDIVINCAAKTNLEHCEENKLVAYATNTQGVMNILHICADLKAQFVHISSGCLFDGNQEVVTEESTPTPGVWYTHTKLWADQYIESYGYDNYLILRPRQMISAVAHPTNMLTKFANYDEIYAHAEPNSVTAVEDFKLMLEHLIGCEAHGIFNCCNEGTLTPYEIAQGVKKYINPDLIVRPATYEYTLALQPNRRVNTILSTEKLKNTGYTPRNAHEALQWTLENYA